MGATMRMIINMVTKEVFYYYGFQSEFAKMHAAHWTPEKSCKTESPLKCWANRRPWIKWGPQKPRNPLPNKDFPFGQLGPVTPDLSLKVICTLGSAVGPVDKCWPCTDELASPTFPLVCQLVRRN